MVELDKIRPYWAFEAAAVPPPMRLPANAVNLIPQQDAEKQRLRAAIKDGHSVRKLKEAIRKEIDAPEPNADALEELEQEVIRLETELATANRRIITDEGLDLDELKARPTQVSYDAIKKALEDSESRIAALEDRPTAESLLKVRQDLEKAQADCDKALEQLKQTQAELDQRPTKDALLKVQQDLEKAQGDRDGAQNNLKQAENDRNNARDELIGRPTAEALTEVNIKLQQAQNELGRQTTTEALAESQQHQHRAENERSDTRKELEQTQGILKQTQDELSRRPTTEALSEANLKLQQADDDIKQLSKRPTEQAHNALRDQIVAKEAELQKRPTADDLTASEGRLKNAQQEASFWREKCEAANQIQNTQPEADKLPNYERESLKSDIAILENRVKRRDESLEEERRNTRLQFDKATKLQRENDQLDAKVLNLEGDLQRARNGVADVQHEAPDITKLKKTVEDERQGFVKERNNLNNQIRTVQQERDGIQHARNQLNQQVGQLQNSLRNADTNLKTANARVAGLETQIEELREYHAPFLQLAADSEEWETERTQLENDVSRLQQDIQTLQADLRTSNQSVADLKSIRAKLLTFMYKLLRIGAEDIDPNYFLVDEDLNARTAHHLELCADMQVHWESGVQNLSASIANAGERLASMRETVDELTIKCRDHEKNSAAQRQTLFKLKGIAEAAVKKVDRVTKMYEQARDALMDVTEWTEAQVAAGRLKRTE